MPYYARASREEKLQAQNKHNLLVLAFLLRLEELDSREERLARRRESSICDSVRSIPGKRSLNIRGSLTLNS